MAQVILANGGVARIGPAVRGGSVHVTYDVSRVKYFHLSGTNPQSVGYTPSASETNPRGTMVLQKDHVITTQNPNGVVSFSSALNWSDEGIAGAAGVNSDGSFTFGAIGFYIVDGSRETLLLHVVLDNQVTKDTDRNDPTQSSFAVDVPLQQSSGSDDDITVTKENLIRANSQNALHDVPDASSTDLGDANMYVSNIGEPHASNRNNSADTRDENQVLLFREHGPVDNSDPNNPVPPNANTISKLWGISGFSLVFSGVVAANGHDTTNKRLSMIIGTSPAGLRSFLQSSPQDGDLILQTSVGRLLKVSLQNYDISTNTATFQYESSIILAPASVNAGDSLHLFCRSIPLHEVERFAQSRHSSELLPVEKLPDHSANKITSDQLGPSVGGTGESSLADAARSILGAGNTGQLPEGSNEYYTATRARAANQWTLIGSGIDFVVTVSTEPANSSWWTLARLGSIDHANDIIHVFMYKAGGNILQCHVPFNMLHLAPVNLADDGGQGPFIRRIGPNIAIANRPGQRGDGTWAEYRVYAERAKIV